MQSAYGSSPETARHISIRQQSVQSLFVQPHFDQVPLASATGFVVVCDDVRYLVTNRHVVTGRDQVTNEPNDKKTAAIPNRILIWHNAEYGVGFWVAKTEDLYDPNGNARWLEHSSHGRAMDVVALPLKEDGIGVYPYDRCNPGASLVVEPAQHVSIIGFPFGLITGQLFATWVGGTIASEPEVLTEDLPRFLVDSRTRIGSSGSPVIAFSVSGFARLTDGSNSIGLDLFRFLGVYSGRIDSEADLGYVWRADAVAELLKSGTISESHL